MTKLLKKHSGCRTGYTCPFRHDPSRVKRTNLSSKGQTQSLDDGDIPAAQAAIADASASASEQSLAHLEAGRQYVPPPVDESRVVQRPTPQAQTQDPRAFQIQQLKRRFSPAEKAENGGTALTFRMSPSDPDFPFELEGLECVLHVPSTYPKEGKPSIDVKNKEMSRGYQINIERGFDALFAKAPNPTLLGLMNALDKNLESLLTAEKAETITIVPNLGAGRTTKPQPLQAPPSSERPRPPKAIQNAEVFTFQQRRIAEARRGTETRQLEARLGRLPLFSKSSDSIAYIIPIEPRRHDDLPVPLQAVKTVRLSVPLLYPLQQCRIEIQGVTREAAAKTERAFERKVTESPEMNLIGHVNYLAQHMHIFATEPESESPQQPIQDENVSPPIEDFSSSQAAIAREEPPLNDSEDLRSHIKFIPRPPEWAAGSDDEASEDSDYSDSYDSGDEFPDEEDETHVQGATPEVPSEPRPERGISLSFPNLELYGIELLELLSLSITVKCERCKDTLDVNNLRNASGTRSESCKKCASSFSLMFRRELIHANAVRAGYLDLDGCTVVDMLPR